MIDLKGFLEAYGANINFFDIDVFEDDIMDIPYQIKILDKNYSRLTLQQQQKFVQLNSKLMDLIKKAEPKNEMQKEILQKVKESVEIELNKYLEVA